MRLPLAIAFFFLASTMAAANQPCSDNISWAVVSSILSVILILVGYRYIRLKSSLDGSRCEKKAEKQAGIADLERKIQNVIERNRRNEEQIFQQSHLTQMGEMVSMIAHQWRQPLGAIASTAIGIETKIRLNKFDFTSQAGIEQTRNYLLGRTELIAKYVDMLTTTIDDFRSFYQKDKHKEYIHLETLIHRALGIIDGALQQKGIRIEIEFDSRNDILLYPNEIVQVILNILQNAYDQFKENANGDPRIKITVHDIDDVVQIEICDNAGGIPDEILPKIFRPYFSTKDKKNGTGIGLYMSKIIIEAHHNGFLSAYNNHDGARFVIQIPRVKEENAS